MAGTQHSHPTQPGYVFLEFPKHRHHAVHGWRQVETKAQEEEFTPDEDGWTDDLLDLQARRVISTDVVLKPRRSHHRKTVEPDVLAPVLGGVSTD